MSDQQEQPDKPDKTGEKDTGEIAIEVGKLGRLHVGTEWREYVGPWLKWFILAVSLGTLAVMLSYAISLIWTAK